MELSEGNVLCSSETLAVQTCFVEELIATDRNDYLSGLPHCKGLVSGEIN